MYIEVECDTAVFFFFQAEDGIRDTSVTGVQTCALPIFRFEPLGGRASNRMRLRELREEVEPLEPRQLADLALDGADVRALEIGRASCRKECGSRGWTWTEKQRMSKQKRTKHQ